MRFDSDRRQLFALSFAALAMLAPVFTLGQQATTARLSAHYLLTADKALVELPLITGVMKGKTKFVIGGVKSVVELPGERAVIRLKANDPQVFVLGVQGPLPEQVPVAMYTMLHKLEAKGGKRQWVPLDITSYVVTATSRDTTRGIPLNFSRFNAQALKVEPRTFLTPGEYAFVMPESDPYAPPGQFRFHCFGVD